MDVDDALGPLFRKILTQNAHKARQNDKFNAVSFQFLRNGSLKASLTAQFLSGADHAGDAGILRPLQGIGAGIACQHQSDAPAVEPSARLCVNEGLQIGAAAGNKYRDVNHVSHLPTA